MPSNATIKKGNRIAKEVRESIRTKTQELTAKSKKKKVVEISGPSDQNLMKTAPIKSDKETLNYIEEIMTKVDKTKVSAVIDKIRDILGPNLFFTDEQVTRLNNELRVTSSRSKSLCYRTEVKYDDETMKLPNQALEILGALTEEPISNKEWIERLGTMKTNQPIEKVLYFYKQRLLKLGLIATK